MPYVRDRDFARIRELVKTIEHLSSKEKHSAIPDISKRALRIMEKYFVDIEGEEE